jgi:predicted choloylglycine hydrolase
LTKDHERRSDSQWLRLDLIVRRGNISVLHSEVRKMAHFEYNGIDFGLRCTKDYKKLSVGLKVGRIELKYLEYEGKADQIDRVLNSKKVKTSQLEIIRPANNLTLLDLQIDKDGTNTKVMLRTQEL